MGDRPSSTVRVAFAAILVLYVLYAGAFVFRTSFVVDGVRHFCLFDDAMISMRYARNVAQGHGPVWNPGADRAEGYTNPLWTCAMTAVHWLPVSESKISLVVQTTAAVLLLVNLLVVRRIAQFLCRDTASAHSEGDRSDSHPMGWLGAVVLTAFYLPLNNWALQGMEVGAATLIVSLAVWKAIGCLSGQRFALSLYLLMGIGVLVRMDMLVPSAVICGFLTLVDGRNRHRHWIAGSVVLGAALALQTGFRIGYYGDSLPNTYYLKMTGYPALLRISRGLLVLWDFIRQMNWVLFLLPLALLLLRRDRYVNLLLSVFAGQLAYSVYVGGDAWEWWGGANRYVSIAMPLFFVLYCCAVDTIAQRAAQRIQDARGAASRPLLRRSYVVTFFVLLGLLNMNALKGPQSLREWLLLDPPLHVADNQQMVRRALLLRDVTRPNARIALVWAGIMPYFADRQMIDISGKNDRYVARLPMHTAPAGRNRLAYFHPGHLKWDYGHSIGKLQPDIVLQAGYPPGEAQKYLEGRYQEVEMAGFTFHLRRQSPNVLWDRVADHAATPGTHEPSLTASK